MIPSVHEVAYNDDHFGGFKVHGDGISYTAIQKIGNQLFHKQHGDLDPSSSGKGGPFL